MNALRSVPQTYKHPAISSAYWILFFFPAASDKYHYRNRTCLTCRKTENVATAGCAGFRQIDRSKFSSIKTCRNSCFLVSFTIIILCKLISCFQSPWVRGFGGCSMCDDHKQTPKNVVVFCRFTNIILKMSYFPCRISLRIKEVVPLGAG